MTRKTIEVFEDAEWVTVMRGFLEDGSRITLKSLYDTHPFDSMVEYACFVTLVAMQGRKVAEIAAAMGVPESTVNHLVMALGVAAVDIGERMGREEPALH